MEVGDKLAQPGIFGRQSVSRKCRRSADLACTRAVVFAFRVRNV
jgi:hypothetical protein